MNSILNDEGLTNNFLNNVMAFTERFPDLARLLHFDEEKTVFNLLKKLPSSYVLEKTRAGAECAPVYSLCVNGKFLHSKYNPVKEAEKTFLSDFFSTCSEAAKKDACIFYGLGLGYLPELYAAANPSSRLVIIEPDLFIFALFLASRPLTAFFKHKNLTLLLGIYTHEAAAFLEAENLQTLPVFKQQAIIEAEAAWFSEFEALKKRMSEKNILNKNTLKKFGMLWLKNLFKNVHLISELEGINRFKNLFKDCPALLIAAGPGLNSQLAVIKEYTDKFIVIASDTSVRACIKNNITPDFILLMDAQYWNYLHIAGLDISSSVLITESSVYPAVLRIKTAATFLCASTFPLAQYIEKASGDNGRIVSGGSVATAVWDFARFLGIKEIIAAGLDLAFTKHQTHFSGSRFEEDNAIHSSRFFPSETASHRTIYAACPELKEGYSASVLTDKRLQMYAWWFESKLAEFPEIKTYNLMPGGLKIPNMPPLLKDDFLKKAEKSGCSSSLKKERIEGIIKTHIKDSCEKSRRIKAALQNLKKDLTQAEKLSKEGAEICALFIKEQKRMPEAVCAAKNERLSEIDKALIENEANRIIGFNLLLNENDNTACTEGDLFLNTYRTSLSAYENIAVSLAHILRNL